MYGVVLGFFFFCFENVLFLSMYQPWPSQLRMISCAHIHGMMSMKSISRIGHTLCVCVCCKVITVCMGGKRVSGGHREIHGVSTHMHMQMYVHACMPTMYICIHKWSAQTHVRACVCVFVYCVYVCVCVLCASAYTCMYI